MTPNESEIKNMLTEAMQILAVTEDEEVRQAIQFHIDCINDASETFNQGMARMHFQSITELAGE